MLLSQSFGVSASSLEARRRVQYREQSRRIVGLYENAVSVSDRLGPGQFWSKFDAYLDPDDLVQLKKGLRGIPNFPKLSMKGDQLLLGDSLTFKVLNAEENLYLLNGREIRLDSNAHILDWLQQIQLHLDSSRNAFNFSDFLFPKAYAMGGGLIAIIIAIIAMLFGAKANRKKKEAAEAAAHEASGGFPGEAGASAGMPFLPPASGGGADPAAPVPPYQGPTIAAKCPAAVTDGSNIEGSNPESLPEFNKAVLAGLMEFPDVNAPDGDERKKSIPYDLGKNITTLESFAKAQLDGGDYKIKTPGLSDWNGGSHGLYCSGANQLLFLKGLEKASVGLDESTATALTNFGSKGSRPADGVGLWGRGNGNGFAFANMIADAQMGFSFEDPGAKHALPGDFVKMIGLGDNDGSMVGTAEGGHLGVFLGWKEEGGKKLMCFYTANSKDEGTYKSGLGSKCVAQDKYSKMIFTRVDAPQNAKKLGEIAKTTDEFTYAIRSGVKDAQGNEIKQELPYEHAKQRAGIASCEAQAI